MAAFVTNVDIIGRVAVADGFFKDEVAAAIGTDAVVVGG